MDLERYIKFRSEYSRPGEDGYETPYKFEGESVRVHEGIQVYGKEKSRSVESEPGVKSKEFSDLCLRIKDAFFEDWDRKGSSLSDLEIQKRAIIGYEKEKRYFRVRIEELLDKSGARSVDYPSWYSSLSDAVYHENWGLAGMAEWFGPGYSSSSSAKIVGERIYFLEEGVMRLKPQRISSGRADQLIKAMLLLSPEERYGKPYHEIYMLDGTRVTIFSEPMAKKGQQSIVFRRYIIPKLTFEEQSARGTIPAESVPLFKSMVKAGFNVAFLGAVRTAKTTFLSTWQSYEDPSMEGVMVETDPEIPLHTILPDSPIVQLLADGEELSRISKNLLRSDADYFIIAEARDGVAMDMALRVASKGSKRTKITFHCGDPKRFPLDAACEIVNSLGGDIDINITRVAMSFDYLLHFVQLPGGKGKRLSSIYSLGCSEEGEPVLCQICEYLADFDGWKFFELCGTAPESGDTSENFKEFEEVLAELSGGGIYLSAASWKHGDSASAGDERKSFSSDSERGLKISSDFG